MGGLQVQAFTGGVGGDENPAERVPGELLGDLAAPAPGYSAVDGRDGAGLADQGADARG
jgi:hypothetical protein